MKNVIKFFAALVAILSFAACQKEMENTKEDTKVTHKVTFVAGNPEAKTTATIDEDVVNYSWKDTDASQDGEVEKFHVFENGVEADEVLAVLEQDGTMTITAYFGGNPPSEEATYTGYFNTGIQSIQEAEGTDYDQLSDVLIAKATTADADGNIPFQFKRLGAICEMNIKGLTTGTYLKRVIIESTDENVFLAGNLVDGELVGNSKTIVINSFSEIASDIAKVRFVSMPVDGVNLKVTVETTEDLETVSGTFYKEFSKPISFIRGNLKAFNVATTEISRGEMWGFEFTEAVFTSNVLTKELNGKEWTVEGTGSSGYFAKDGNGRGEQFGSNNNPFTTLSFTSSAFGEDYFVKDIRVTATSGTTPVNLSVTVGGVTLKNGNNSSASLSTSEDTYVFNADYLLSGDIKIFFEQTADTKKAIYVHEIVVNYIARCESPVANPASGSEVVGGSKIELSSETDGASIYYTLDGETPTTESTLYNNTNKVTMPNDDCTLKAIAVKNGMSNSLVAEFSYTLPTVAKPTLSFKKGEIVAACTTEGATIRYKIGDENVSEPTESDNEYNAAKKPTISANQYASVKAFKTGYHASPAVKTQYVAGAGIIDVINADAVSVGGVAESGTTSWVTDFNVNGNSSDAVYRIHTMGTKGSTDALRFNNNGFLNTTTSGGLVKKITIEGANKKYNIFGQNSAFGTSKPSGTATGTLAVSNGTGSYEFTADYEYVAIVGTESSSTITSITIEWGEPKAERELAFFNGEAKVTEAINVNLGESFIAPVLKDGTSKIESGVTYTSNNEDVAEVNSTTGAVTLKKHGEVTISASVDEDETHKSGEASYTIQVSHVLSGISLAEDSAHPTELYKDTEFNFSGIKLNANYNDECVEDVTSELTVANFSGYNMSVIGEQAVTITYNEKTTTYKLTILEAANLHTIDYSGGSDSNGNSVSGVAQAAEGDEVTLTVSLESGYYLTSLTVDGIDKFEEVNDNQVSFTMGDHDVAVVATFSNEYTVKFTPSPANGTVTVNGNSTGSVKVAAGATVSLAGTPADAAHVFNEWTVNPAQSFTSGTAKTASAEFVMPAQDVEVSGSFVEKPKEFVRITNLNDITPGKYIIVNNGNYLPNTSKGASTAPSLGTFAQGTIVNDAISSEKAPADAIWYFTQATGGFYIRNAESNGDYLYATNNNNGIRVHTTKDSWTFENHGTGTFAMKDATNGRYCATFTSDWRSYTTKDYSNYNDEGHLMLYRLEGYTPASPTTYTLKINDCENGNITAKVGNLTVENGAKIESGETVTITATADSGYEFSSWNITGATPSDPSASSTTITMNGNVSLGASFSEKQGGGDESTEFVVGTDFKNLTDVNNGVTKNGITVKSNTTAYYSPLRIYAKNTITISSSSANITKVVITGYDEDYIKTWKASNSGSCTVNGTTMTWTSTNGLTTITFTMTASAQARITKIVVN